MLRLPERDDRLSTNSLMIAHTPGTHSRMPPIGPHHTPIRSQPEYLALARALAKEQVSGNARGQLAVLVLVRREMLQMPWPHTAMVYVCMQALI